MAKLGPNTKLHLRAQDLASFRAVMLDVFEAVEVSADPRMVVFDLDGSRVGAALVSDGTELSAAQARAAGTWLEILVGDPEPIRARLAALGITPFEYADKTHHYYQLPGGQVVRVAASA